MHNGNKSRYNSPSIFNLSQNYPLGWEGQLISMQEQMHSLVAKQAKMGLNWDNIENRLRQQPAYDAQFSRLYPEGITRETITQALVTYQLALTTPLPLMTFFRG
ncbi:cytochrome-c peroxidase [Aliamphritea spongicola]|nr:cytochrome-c peroxidase [Aliamphritea spongicola]